MNNIAILNWAAWAPGLSNRDTWEKWSHSPMLPVGDEKIQTTTIPPKLKRRCTNHSKMALEVSNIAMMNHDIDYALFCSQHGELQSTMSLLHEIYHQTELSPTAFSQSVHNTAAGVFAMMHERQHNISALAAGRHSFSMGMHEAIAWLQQHPTKKMLLTISDETIPHEYDSLNVKDNCNYAVSFVLQHQPHTTLPTYEQHELPEALAFLARWLSS